MDIDKLIDRLKKAQADGSWNTLADFAHKAAEALSTLQAELEAARADRDGRCVALTSGADYIPRQSVIDLLYYYADEACSAVVADVERIPGVFVGIDDSWLMKRFTEVI